MEMRGRETTTTIGKDADLVEALRLHDPTAAERLIETYGDRAYRLASRMTRNAQDAEEVVQDAFLAVVRRIDTFRGASAFGSWLYRIVANAAYQKLRGRRARRGELTLDDVLPDFGERGQHRETVADWSAAAAEPSVQAELRIALGEAIDELPADYRAVVVLHDVEGRSHEEVAETLRLTVPNVKSRVHRARLFLRERLGQYMTARRDPRRGKAPPATAMAACA